MKNEEWCERCGCGILFKQVIKKVETRLIASVLFLSLLKNEIDRQDQEDETDKMVEPEGFVFKDEERKEGEDDQRDDFLYDFQL